ncbi:MAG TPA: hypothetical protein VIF02_07460, partial [Methylocella sp.]
NLSRPFVIRRDTLEAHAGKRRNLPTDAVWTEAVQFRLQQVAHAPVTPWDRRLAIVGGPFLRLEGRAAS